MPSKSTNMYVHQQWSHNVLSMSKFMHKYERNYRQKQTKQNKLGCSLESTKQSQNL